MAAVLLRPVAAGDIPAITAIYAEAVETGTSSFELTPPDAAEMERRRQALVAGNYPYIVAELDGAILGYAYAGVYRARPAYQSTVENSVYVAGDSRGLGLGRRLLDALVAGAAARGFRQMIAVIGDSGNAASVRLHERAGFRMVGTLQSVGWKHGRWLDTVLMQRELGSGDTAPRE